MQVILKMFLLNAYGEDWWKMLIPIWGDYLLCTAACSPIFFWLIIGCAVLACFSVVLFSISPFISLILVMLFVIASLIIYSIILFALFTGVDEIWPKLCAIGIFVIDVVFPIGTIMISAGEILSLII